MAGGATKTGTKVTVGTTKTPTVGTTKTATVGTTKTATVGTTKTATVGGTKTGTLFSGNKTGTLISGTKTGTLISGTKTGTLISGTHTGTHVSGTKTGTGAPVAAGPTPSDFTLHFTSGRVTLAQVTSALSGLHGTVTQVQAGGATSTKAATRTATVGTTKTATVGTTKTATVGTTKTATVGGTKTGTLISGTKTGTLISGTKTGTLISGTKTGTLISGTKTGTLISGTHTGTGAPVATVTDPGVTFHVTFPTTVTEAEIQTALPDTLGAVTVTPGNTGPPPPAPPPTPDPNAPPTPDPNAPPTPDPNAPPTPDPNAPPPSGTNQQLPADTNPGGTNPAGNGYNPAGNGYSPSPNQGNSNIIDMQAASSWTPGTDGFTVPTTVSAGPVALPPDNNYRGIISELDPITASDVQTAGQIRYVVMLINGNPWGYTTGVTTDPSVSLAAIQNKVSAHRATGVAANQTTFSANDAATMDYNNRLLVSNTVEIPYNEIASNTLGLTSLRSRLTNADDIARVNDQIAKNNAKMSKLQQAMTGGRRKRRHKHGRSRRRRLVKRAKRHSKTRRSRR